MLQERIPGNGGAVGERRSVRTGGGESQGGECPIGKFGLPIMPVKKSPPTDQGRSLREGMSLREEAEKGAGEHILIYLWNK